MKRRGTPDGPLIMLVTPGRMTMMSALERSVWAVKLSALGYGAPGEGEGASDDGTGPAPDDVPEFPSDVDPFAP